MIAFDKEKEDCYILITKYVKKIKKMSKNAYELSSY